MSAPPRTSQAFVAWLDPAGRVHRVLRDDLGLPAAPGVPLAACVDSESADKAGAFLAEIRQHGAALSWELNALLAGQACTLSFTGFLVDDRLLVSALRAAPDGDLFRDELTRMANELAAAQRALAKQNSALEAQVAVRTRQLEAYNQQLLSQVAERRAAEEKLAVSNQELRELSARLESLREDERRSLSRELHDVLGGALTELKLAAAAIHRQLPDHSDAPRLSLTQLGHRIDGIVQIVRGLAASLRPSLLDDFGLVAALEWQAEEFQRRSSIACRFVSELPAVTLDPAQATALYRVLQEALTNIIRHAQATRVDVRLANSAGRLVLEIADNGRGFTVSEPGRARSLGLIGMRERIWLVGGEFDLHSQPGQGTRLRVAVPFQG